MACTAHKPLGAAGLKQHRAEIRHIVHQRIGLLDRHALRFSDFEERFGKLGAQRVGCVVDDGRAAQIVSRRCDGLRIPDDDQIGEPLGKDAFGRDERALVFSFRKHDRSLLLFGLGIYIAHKR